MVLATKLVNMKKILLLIVVVWCFGDASFANEMQASSPIPEIVVEKQQEEIYHTTHYLAKKNYSVHSGAPQHELAQQCQIVWSVRRSPRYAQGFSFSEKSKCSLPIVEQQPYRAALLQHLLQDAPGLAGVRGFAWGSLWRGDANDAYVQRVQDALRQDVRWHKASRKRGFQQGEAYNLLPKILQEKQVFAELHALFSVSGLRLRVGEVEKIQFGADGLPTNFLLYFRFDGQ